MGFERHEAVQALRLSRNDYDLACDYLLNSDSRLEANSLLLNEPPVQPLIMSQGSLSISDGVTLVNNGDSDDVEF